MIAGNRNRGSEERNPNQSCCLAPAFPNEMNSSMKIMLIVGARPNFMKAVPIVAAIKRLNGRASAATVAIRHDVSKAGIELVLVHTGQHYDKIMSDRFFADLDLPKPDFQLGVGSGSHAEQTGEVMRRFEPVLLSEQPDVVMVVGDVNSTLACALATSKTAFGTNGTRPLIAHVEAGLRSFDSSMPEEINRVLTDHISDLLFVTEESGVKNLRAEGIPAEKIHFVGNTMIDSLLSFSDLAERSSILDDLILRLPANANESKKSIKRYALLTLHRPSNVDRREGLEEVLAGIEDLASCCPIVFPAHPRTQKRIAEFGLQRFFASMDGMKEATQGGKNGLSSGIHVIQPLGYLDFLCLMKHVALVVTDSGGIQEETTCLGVPCVTTRPNTERPVTVTNGTNRIGGTDRTGIREAIRLQLMMNAPSRRIELWDGKAAERIMAVIQSKVNEREAAVVAVRA